MRLKSAPSQAPLYSIQIDIHTPLSQPATEPMKQTLFTIALVTLIPIAAIAQSRDHSKRNVLFLVTDDCNVDLSCYGHELVKTPNIDKLAKRGVLFSRAYAQYPVCNPSRSSFMTGLYPYQTGVLSNGGDFRKQNPNVVTLSQMFRNHGYTAARVGKIYHYGVPGQIGTDGEDDLASWDIRINPRGIDREIHERIHSIRPNAPIESRFGGTLSWLRVNEESALHTDGIGATEAIRMLDELHPQKTGRPFFLAVGFYRPHTPYVAPSRFFEMYASDEIHPVMERPDDRDDIPLAAWHDRPGQRELTIEQRKEIIQAYYASISFMDEQVGRVVDALGERNLDDKTVIVFLSDHGYHLGAHGLWQKSDLFEGSCHVPLVIVEPNSSERGSIAPNPVELIDLYPTLADLCGVEAPSHIRGTSLVPVLANPEQIVKQGALSVTVSRAYQMHKVFTKKRVMGHSIRTKQYRYTQWGDGKYGHELYDYESDPNEYTNLADRPEYADPLRVLRAALNEAVRRAK